MYFRYIPCRNYFCWSKCYSIVKDICYLWLILWIRVRRLSFFGAIIGWIIVRWIVSVILLFFILSLGFVFNCFFVWFGSFSFRLRYICSWRFLGCFGDLSFCIYIILFIRDILCCYYYHYFMSLSKEFIKISYNLHISKKSTKPIFYFLHYFYKSNSLFCHIEQNTLQA